MIPSSRLALAAVTLAVPLGWSLATAQAAGGGLAVTPAVIEQTAARGANAPITIANTTNETLRVTVTPRPWTQSRTGAVAPNRRRTLLSRLGVSVRSFDLPAGGRRTVSMSVRSLPSGGSLYGSIETVGVPRGKAKKNGIRVAYRLISTLRLNPAASKRRLAVRAAAPKVKGSTIVLPVRNAGNTAGPISGDVRITGARGTKTGAVRAARILPGSLVELPLGSTRGLPRGTYTVTAALTQDGKRVLRSVRRVRVD